MTTVKLLPLMMAILFSCGHAVFGATTVIKTFLPAAGGGSQTTTHGTGQDITVVVDNTVEKVQIYASTTDEQVGRVFIDGDGPQSVYIYLVRPGGSTSPGDGYYSPIHAAGGNWAGFQDLRGKIQLRGIISGNLTGSIIIEDVNTRPSGLQNFSTTGNVGAGIFSGTNGSFRVMIGSTGSNADFMSESSITELIVTNGDLTGDVIAEDSITLEAIRKPWNR